MKRKLELKHFLELKGNRVRLQKLDAGFTAVYLEAMGKLDLATKVSTTTGQVYAAGDIERYIERVSTDSSRIDFLVLDIDSERLLGEVVLTDFDFLHRNAHVRIAIARREDFGKGYGSEAMLLALHYGFGMQQMHRIELEVMPFNTRAIKLYEQLGFRREGVKREACYFNHRYHDIILMSMLAAEFRQRYLDEETLLDSFTV